VQDREPGRPASVALRQERGTLVKTDYLRIVVLGFLPLLARCLFYWFAFRIRSINIKLVSCLVIAGVPYFLFIVPLPLPRPLSFLLIVGFVAFLITRYTEAELYPDAILIPFVVELVSLFLLDHVLIPLFA
jgi:hypothetical protein